MNKLHKFSHIATTVILMLLFIMELINNGFKGIPVVYIGLTYLYLITYKLL